MNLKSAYISFSPAVIAFFQNFYNTFLEPSTSCLQTIKQNDKGQAKIYAWKALL